MEAVVHHSMSCSDPFAQIALLANVCCNESSSRPLASATLLIQNLYQDPLGYPVVLCHEDLAALGL